MTKKMYAAGGAEPDIKPDEAQEQEVPSATPTD